MYGNIIELIFDQERKNRVGIFREYARKRKESVWAQFLNLLNRPDPFIQEYHCLHHFIIEIRR